MMRTLTVTRLELVPPRKRCTKCKKLFEPNENLTVRCESCDTDERYTPDNALEVVRRFAGGAIVLDPCAPAHNPVHAITYYTKTDNGLRDWSLALSRPGPARCVCWINPPFSRGNLDQWVPHIIEQFTLYGAGRHFILCLPSDFSTRAGAKAFAAAHAVCFPPRLKFNLPSGPSSSSADKANALLYFGADVRGFYSTFAHALGTVRSLVLPA